MDGDANFMTPIANTRTLPEPLDDTAAQAPRRLAVDADVQARTEARWARRVAATASPDDLTTIRDELPDDLNPTEFVGAYQFPDNSRRRIPGAIYLVLGRAVPGRLHDCADVADRQRRVVLGRGIARRRRRLISITSGWRMHVDEKEALVEAQQAIGFPVGHASAQQVWHGIRSRPTWRVLCYSAEEPPQRRGLVLVDAVDGRVDPAPRRGQPRSIGDRRRPTRDGID